MSHAATVEEVQDHPMGLYNGKLGTWLFLCSEIMFFAGLIGSYIVLRSGTASWPQPGQILNIPLTGVNTFVLICSSVTMVKAFQWCLEGHQKRTQRNLFLTFLFGVLFLVIQAIEYHKLFHHGLKPWGGPDPATTKLYGTCFYILTGFHGFHVFCGVVAVFVIFMMSLFGRFSRTHYAEIELVGLYWHFVDLVWIILFTILYLI